MIDMEHAALREITTSRHISMCVLSYNRPEFLRQSIQTMVYTADEPLEIIVHDDGSDPDTTHALDEMRRSGLISTVILNAPGHNEGQGVAVNRMFAMATGDILVKADHDLLYRTGWTRAIRDTLAINAERAENSLEPRIGALGLFKYNHPPVAAEDMLIRSYEGWEEHKDFCGSLIAVPRDAWNRFGPWEERSAAFAEDNTFKLDVAEANGWCVALTPHDYVSNIGFGEGPSTVVVRREGELTSRAIKSGPRLIERDAGGRTE